MECTEARALKHSFLSQMASSQMLCDDDVWRFNAAAAPEDFPVEDLLNLDFSDKEFQDCGGAFEEDEEGFSKLGNKNSSSAFSGGADDFDSLSTGNFAVEVEGLESLEWLSQFVDDSTAEPPSLWPIGSSTAKATTCGGALTNAPSQDNRATFYPTPVPRKRRNKRQRSSGLRWSSVSPPLSSVDSTSAASSSSHGSSSLPTLVFTYIPHDPDWFSSIEKPPPAKKPKRKPENENGAVPGRRCTHCQVQKTPQWRTGPLGPKTLCNACGVRFKSGRLFPEYRPACSPTFSQAVHSNSHRKVLEMRGRKETSTAIDDHSGFVTPVVSVVVSD